MPNFESIILNVLKQYHWQKDLQNMKLNRSIAAGSGAKTGGSSGSGYWINNPTVKYVNIAQLDAKYWPSISLEDYQY